VTTKKPRTGGEIDSYCTKCRLDLTHRIIAMVGEAVKKVECKTCGSHHLYRKPKSERTVPGMRNAMVKRAPDGTTRPLGPAPTTHRVTAADRANAAERAQAAAWEHAIAGQPATAFKVYRISASFGQGELIRHPKFGDGVVARVIDRGKVEVLFKDGPRTMAHGQA
jgi:hypothetical protein